jgi:predicted RNase H-like nuclease (RuvC/YqgF family)
MAYDPKDPEDKKIVDKLIKDAVEAREAELETAHEEAVTGLKKKNKELLAKNKAGEHGDPKEIEKLETDLEAANTTIRNMEKDKRKHERTINELTAERDGERKAINQLLVDKGLTEALTANKVAPQFLPAAKALLQSRVTVKQDGEARTAVIGDKSLGDAVKEWSLGDEGKHYVAAPANGGGGAPGGHTPQGGAKPIMTRAAFNALSLAEQANAAGTHAITD